MKPHLLLWALGAVLASSCRKDDVIDCGPAVPSLTFQELTRRNAAPVQVFNLANVAQAQVVRTAGGAELQLPAGGFLTPGGQPATGPAQVRLREIYTPIDMILVDLPTVTGPGGAPVGLASLPGGAPLQSGGEFSIQVWQGGQRLVPVPGGFQFGLVSPRPARVSPSQSVDPMGWWQRPFPAPSPAGRPDTSGWQRAPGFVLDTTGAGGRRIYRTAFALDSTSWYNIDQLWQNAASAIARYPIRVTVPAGGLTRVYFVPTQANGVFRGYPTAPTTWTIGSVPVGPELTAVVIQEQANGPLRFGTQRVRANDTVAPVLEELTEAEIVQRLRQL